MPLIFKNCLKMVQSEHHLCSTRTVAVSGQCLLWDVIKVKKAQNFQGELQMGLPHVAVVVEGGWQAEASFKEHLQHLYLL